MTAVSTLTEDQRYGAGLAALGASPGMLRKFLDGYDAAEAWEAIARGTSPRRPRRAATAPRRFRELDTRGHMPVRSAGVSVMVLGRPGYPPALADDRQAPAVLFCTGDGRRARGPAPGGGGGDPVGHRLRAGDGRRARSRPGAQPVWWWCRGLALGIDAAAHGGALGRRRRRRPPWRSWAPPSTRPRRRSQSALRDALGGAGAVLSEIPPGVHSARWWFAVRNRVMAALAHVVVVVECHHRGGSLHTVAAAWLEG